MSENSGDLIPEKKILKIIMVVRGAKVILDSDLATLYGVETRRLNEQVRRNIGHARFKQDVELDKACRPAVSVGKRVNPRQIEVSENGTQNAEGDLIVFGGGRDLAVDPVAQPLEKVFAVFSRCPAVGCNNHRIA